MTEWEGKERRASSVSLQDILLEVRELKTEVSHLIKGLNTHLEDDKESFVGIKKDITFLQRCAFGLFGAWALFQFFISSGAININNSFSSPNDSDPRFGNTRGYYVGGHKDASGEGIVARRTDNKSE